MENTINFEIDLGATTKDFYQHLDLLFPDFSREFMSTVN